MRVFDFDGVLIDSTREVYLCSRIAFELVSESTSSTAKVDFALDQGMVEVLASRLTFSESFEQFSVLRPLIISGFEYFNLWSLISNCKNEISMMGGFVEVRKILGRLDAKAERFAIYFSEVRRQIKALDMDFWLSLNDPLIEVKPYLSADTVNWILSNKPAEDVYDLLRLLTNSSEAAFDLVPGASKTSGGKSRRLTELCLNAEIDLGEIVFFDDFPPHVEEIGMLGCRSVFVDWGRQSEINREYAKEKFLIFAKDIDV